MIHIMLDLETWGTTPGSDLRSIGACVFDPVSGHVASPDSGFNGEDHVKLFYIATDNPAGRMRNGIFETHLARGNEDYRKYDLTRDPATVQWWTEQSEEAQTAFADPVDLRDALMRFGEWLRSVTDGAGLAAMSLRLWSHGPAFDPPILAAAYAAVGLPVPWHYRAPRDTRTCFDMVGIDDDSAWLNQHPGPLAIPHHALDDAICQARAVCAAWRRLPLYPERWSPPA